MSPNNPFLRTGVRAALLPAWTGEIIQLRIDPILYGDGGAIGVDSIVLTP